MSVITIRGQFWKNIFSVLLIVVLFLAFGLVGLCIGILYQVLIAPPKRLTIILLIIWDLLIFLGCGYFSLIQVGVDLTVQRSQELLLVLVACGVIFQAMLSQYQLVKATNSKQVTFKSATAALLTIVSAAGLGEALYGIHIPSQALILFAFLFFCLSILLRLFVAPSFAAITKRMLDVGIALALLLLLFPLFGLIAACILRTGRPIFFGHERVGLGGIKFKCYKFRSMVPNACETLQELLENDPKAKAEWEKDFKLKDDPRITDVGIFLRRTSLDELPQLWNVLKGDMSLVGPRPITEQELQRYKKSAKHYLKTKPGMTGLWQVNGRNDVDYEARVRMDRWYAKNWSVVSDFIILLRTLFVVLRKKGSY